MNKYILLFSFIIVILSLPFVTCLASEFECAFIEEKYKGVSIRIGAEYGYREVGTKLVGLNDIGYPSLASAMIGLWRKRTRKEH